jgi:4-amino-4-deoxy-L-arabinose transferase-like glycosyltransferase
VVAQVRILLPFSVSQFPNRFHKLRPLAQIFAPRPLLFSSVPEAAGFSGIGVDVDEPVVHQIPSPQRRRSTLRALTSMVVVGLLIRLVCMGFLYTEHTSLKYDHFKFGFEAGRIARSIVQGEGFSSPLFEKTGPTAWMTPVYPYIIAGFFKIFGVYTRSALFAVLSFQSLTSALTSVPIFFFARKSFGPRVAMWAGWAWTFFPYAIYFPLDRIWETWLATLLFSIVFWVSQELEETDRISAWVGAGLLWGVSALTTAALLTVLPFLQAYTSYRRHKQGKPWLVPNAALGLAFVAAITPWFVRNYRTFHAFIPFRDNMGLVLRLGTKGDTDYWEPSELGPWSNRSEVAEFQRDGEMKYMATKKAQAIAFIKQNPRWYAWTTLRRVVFIWTGYWSLTKEYLALEPWDPWNIPFCSAFTILAFVGLRKAWVRSRRAAMPYAILLGIFPLIYYITSPEFYYRRPLDPMMLVLATYALLASSTQTSEAGATGLHVVERQGWIDKQMPRGEEVDLSEDEVSRRAPEGQDI